MALKLRHFNTENIFDGACITIIGRKMTGKSVLTKHIISLFPDIPRGLVFTSDTKSGYRQSQQDVDIHNEYRTDVLQSFINNQRQRIRDARKGKNNDDNRAFVILEDPVYYDNKSDKTIRDLIQNSKSLKLLVLVILQNPNMSLENRCNTDFVFLFRENTLKLRRMMYENFGDGIVDSFEKFNEILEQCTDDYGSLVINNTSHKTNVEDVMFWYKVDEESVQDQEEDIRDLDEDNDDDDGEESDYGCIIS